MRKKQHSKKLSKEKGGIIFPVLLGTLSSLLILIALIILFSAITLLSASPHKLIIPLCAFSLLTASFFGGFITVKKNKCRDSMLCGLLCGICTTIIFSAIFLIIGALFSVEDSVYAWIFRLFTIIRPIIGGIVASKGKKRSPRRKRF